MQLSPICCSTQCRKLHQNQWLAAIEELAADGLETSPVPSPFSQELEKGEYAYQFWHHSQGQESAEGRWASGDSPDGKGEFSYVADPQPLGEEPVPPVGEARLHTTSEKKEL
jgi:Mn-containing catalase